ncbi:MAG: ornithine aminomutase [Tenericutes bacterium HGW-Tenericutes-6]|nr:MAG: ornithine aminomutase [Tenericutes bacterium HGW-Tenericutes-6]
MKQRNDDFKERHIHLKDLSDEALKERFQELTDQIIDPLLDMAYHYTTPAIERSVLMRMGFSSLEAKEIVNKMNEHNLLGHGAGHVVYKYHVMHKVSIREAGLALLDQKNLMDIAEVFK